jgi:hypothetical protein
LQYLAPPEHQARGADKMIADTIDAQVETE